MYGNRQTIPSGWLNGETCVWSITTYFNYIWNALHSNRIQGEGPKLYKGYRSWRIILSKIEWCTIDHINIFTGFHITRQCILVILDVKTKINLDLWWNLLKPWNALSLFTLFMWLLLIYNWSYLIQVYEY